jgi:hypothetical protein
MTTTINADDGSVSGSAGLKSTADSSGVLALQTNGVSALYVSADGRIALGSATNTSSQVYVGGASRVAATTVYQVRADSTVDSATTTAIGFGTTYQFPATGSVTSAYGFLAGTLSTSGATILNYYGFYANNQTTGTSNNYGYFSNMAAATGKWNFYASGTADNYFAGNLQMSGAVMPYAPAPTSIAAAATLTNAQIQGQIINTTGTTYTVTMPLGTTLETLATWATTNIAYDFYVVNTATGTITMAVNTGVTSVGTLTVTTGVSAQFRIRRTAANTFVLYRLG